MKKIKYYYFNSLMIVVGLLLLANGVIAQDGVKQYYDGETYAFYATSNGMLNGLYTSYYYNNKKKAEGWFGDNNRVGEWSVWDSTGKLIIQRVYSNMFQYKTIIPHAPNGPAKLLSAAWYIPKRDADSCYKYCYLEEREVAFAKRTWSYMFNQDNPALCINNKLFKILYKQILNHNIQTYEFVNRDWDASFRDTINIANVPIDTNVFNVIGFLTKEDWFYNIDAGIMDYRILGICPIAVIKHTIKDDTINAKYLVENSIGEGHDTIGMCWLYYPQLRKYLAKEKIIDSNAPSLIKNMEDVFFWKYYSFKIVGDGLIYRREGLMKDNWQFRMKFVDVEHDIWLGKSAWTF
jgi:hypothetical protein